MRDVAREKAEKLRDAAKAASSLTRAAKEAGRELVASKPFTRFDQEAGSAVSPELATALFNAKVNQPIVAPTSSGFAVASVTKILPDDPGKHPEAAKALEQQLEHAQASDAIAQFLNALRKRYSVEINRAAVESVAGINSGG